ncbi:hypothetical protein TIFTF001_032390 [Ficus carica]|uniref:Uncharacterized protein n=1 Tax=Ficus carica TaxID=3494 RepID=A0AA88DWM6_FICCA|nr:hypothetical protein TIFTF001_032390 [Ficus carica]
MKRSGTRRDHAVIAIDAGLLLSAELEREREREVDRRCEERGGVSGKSTSNPVWALLKENGCCSALWSVWEVVIIELK